MGIPDADFYPSRIQKQQHKRVVKNLLSYLFFVGFNHKFNKIENYFIFEMPKKKIRIRNTENYHTLLLILSHSVNYA